MANNLIEPGDPLLANLDFTNLEALEQAQIRALTEAATTWIEKYTNRVFRSTVYVDEAHDGNGELYIYVKNPPLITLTQVTIQETSFSGATTSTDFAASKFDTNTDTGKIKFKPGSFLSSGASKFTEGFQNVLIDYTGGFDPIPEPIKLVAAEFIVEMFDPSEKVGGIEKEKLGNYFYSKGTKFFEQLVYKHRHILDSYRILRV